MEGHARVAVAALIVGFAAIAVLDPIAARNGRVPLFSARLRPTRMPIASLVAILIVA